MHDLIAIERLLQNWPLPSSVQSWHTTGAKGNVVLLTLTSGAQYILKELAGDPPLDRLRAEYSVMEYLATAGLPIAVPLLTYQRQPFAQVDQNVYTLAPALHPHHTGAVTDEAHLYSNIGSAIGRLHTALANYDRNFPSWTMDLPHTLQTEILPFLVQHLSSTHAPLINVILSTSAEPMYQALTDLPMQRIHGDCHGGNIMWDSEDVFGIIDLDHLPIGPRIYDLGHLFADMVKNRIGAPAQLSEWLGTSGWLIRGYEREIALTEREKTALWYSMLASQFLFIHWFVKHEQAELTAKNVNVLWWIFQQKEAIEAQIKASGESKGKPWTTHNSI